MKRKLFPKGDDCIRALKDVQGKSVTSRLILILNYNSYRERLTKNGMKDHLKEFEVMKENLWSMRKRIAENNKTILWTMENPDCF